MELHLAQSQGKTQQQEQVIDQQLSEIEALKQMLQNTHQEFQLESQNPRVSLHESHSKTPIHQTNKTNLLSQEQEQLMEQESLENQAEQQLEISDEEDQEVDFCDEIPALHERISQLKQKLIMYKQAVVNLQSMDNQGAAEDNIFYLYQLHKNIALTKFYGEIIPDDPVARDDFQEEDYQLYFEENFNDIGNNIIHFVAFLSKKVEETSEELSLA